MNKEEIEEIETLEIDFKDTDELELALEVSSKKAIYLIDDLIKHLFELQQENKKYKEIIDKATNDLEIIIGIVREQHFGDRWIINRLEANKNILKEVE